MKKSKILVPALGILCLGMAAAVTGTVAWFSANTTVYADGISVKSQTAQSLVISLEQSANYGIKVTHSMTDQQLYPSYMINPTSPALTSGEGKVASSTAPQFVMLDQSKVDGTGTWYVGVDGKVYTVSGDAEVAPATPATTNPWLASTQVMDAKEYLKLEGEGDTTKTVKLKATFSRTTEKAIDQSLRLAFWDGANISVVKPYQATGADNTQAVEITQTFSVTADAKEVHAYVYYDGTDATSTNANATANLITVNLAYSIVTGA